MSTAVVIVNYRTAALVVDCLASIAEHAHATPPRTLVVDNKSPDDSLAVLADAISRRGWSSWVELIAADRNGGFAWGNNLAIGTALARNPDTRRVLLLNPDTLVRPGAIDTLVRFMDDHPRAGIVGSRLEDPDATPQRSAFRWPTPLAEFDAAARLGLISRLLASRIVAPPARDQAHRTDWVAGASMLIRREVLDAVGRLDDRYFMYYEEVDFCRRAADAGWECWYVPESRVVHLVGQASGIVHGQAKRRPPYWFESRRRYFLSHHGRLGSALADLAWVLGLPLFHVKRVLLGRPNPDPPRFLRDLLAHSLLARRGHP